MMKFSHPQSYQTPKHRASNRSPISVLCDENEDFPQKLVSMISMSETGTEVTLSGNSKELGSSDEFIALDCIDYENEIHDDSPNFNSIQRKDIIRSLPTQSLLDDDTGISPMTPEKCRPAAYSIWCGSQNLSCYRCDDVEAITPHYYNMENTISNFLSRTDDDGNWCASWQAWSYFEIETPFNDPAFELKADIKRVLRNRAGNIQARSNRIRNLKTDLYPFTNSPKRKMSPISKSYSFSMGYRRPSKVPKQGHTNSLITLCSSSVFNQFTHEKSESPFTIRTRGLEEEEAFYDSDPEESTRQRSQERELVEPRRSENDFSNRSEKNICDNYLGHSYNIGARTDIDDNDERAQEVLNQRFRLIWYTAENGCVPIAVDAWFERGQQLCQKLIQPRLVWKRVNDGGDLNCRQSIDLLDISKVLEGERSGHINYPMARRQKCLVIHTLDAALCFEAKTEIERDRLCDDLKIVVARLGSQVVLEDVNVFDEFFVDGFIPGESPW
jgi:hypothetical protein